MLETESHWLHCGHVSIWVLHLRTPSGVHDTPGHRIGFMNALFNSQLNLLLSLDHTGTSLLGQGCELVLKGVVDKEGLRVHRQRLVTEDALTQSHRAVPAVTAVLFLLENLLELIANLLAALQAEGGSAAEVRLEDMRAQLLAEGTLVLEVLEKEQVAI